MPPLDNDANISAGATVEHPIELDIGENKEINDLFSSAPIGVASNLAHIYI